jgi:hypothetical protein
MADAPRITIEHVNLLGTAAVEAAPTGISWSSLENGPRPDIGRRMSPGGAP